jgi:hypothetical protein
VVDYVGKWTVRAELSAKQLLGWIGLPISKYHLWRQHYGRPHAHNAHIPRDGWLEAPVSTSRRISLQISMSLCTPVPLSVGGVVGAIAPILPSQKTARLCAAILDRRDTAPAPPFSTAVNSGSRLVFQSPNAVDLRRR